VACRFPSNQGRPEADTGGTTWEEVAAESCSRLIDECRRSTCIQYSTGMRRAGELARAESSSSTGQLTTKGAGLSLDILSCAITKR